uniref:Ubiquitin carboxyl-terminal hydrolase n=1 Tax=Strigamia maritima TaxID=126957 RepID=T1IR82_STRMM
MPSSSVDSYDLIEQSLQSSLNGPSTSCGDGSAVNSFEENLLASSKKVLMSKIEFEPAGKNYSFSLKNLKNKYIHLNPKNCKSNDSTEMNGNGYNHTPVAEDDGIPTPKVMIHPPDRVTLGWQRVYRIGAGLLNMGNTCFLNAILQCLTYTPPLVNHLIEFDEHSTNCKMSIAKNMAWGHQEDAHEFLRYIMESMIKSSLKGYSSSSLDRISLETTVVNHIFGGYHRSQVICLKCKSKSDTYEHFMDLILDIKTVPSLEKAMEKFVQAELLDNDNAYMCPRCLKKCPAQKRFSIHRAPNIATFQLKRFDYNRMMGGKISKNITFPEKLDMRSYMSQTQGPPVKYQLYAVLVHQGASCSSGHYFCFVRNSNNLWYCMDDCRIRQVSLNIVLSQQAYLLFYTRVANNPTYFSKSSTTTLAAATLQTPHNSIVLNGTTNHEPHNKIINNATKQTSTCTAVNGNIRNRNRIPTISATGPLIPLTVNVNPEMIDPKQPRIVMHIKNGKVTTNDQNWKEKNEKDENHVNLVPYGPDTSSDEDDDKRVINLPNGTEKDEDGKIKATSSWVVTSTGSPAASECGSVKSTIVGWTVTRVDTKEEEKGGRTYPGWTVTEKDVPHRLLGGKEATNRRYYDDDSQLLRHRRNSLSHREEDNRRHSDTETQMSRGKVYYEEKRGAVAEEGVEKGCASRVNGVGLDSLDLEEEKKGRKRRREEDEGRERKRRRNKCSNGGGRRKRRHDSESEHSSDGSEESYELEWVERTKETMEQERQLNSVTVKHEVPHSNNVSTQNGKDRYDERRHSTNNGVADYFKNVQHNAYGSKINSWNGGQSSLDRESCSAPPRWQENNDYDDYDDEYDKGRVKKNKMYKPNRNEFSRFNQFQRCQNDRNYYSNNNNNNTKQDRPPFNSFSRKPYFHHNNHNHRNNYSNSNFKYQNNKFRGKKQNGGL